MKSLPTLGMKHICQFGRKQSWSGEIRSFFPNIFKIKDKILSNFSVASPNSWLSSSKYQNKGQRTYPYICGRVTIDI